MPVVLGRDYEASVAVGGDESVPDGLGDGVGQAVLIQGNVGAVKSQGDH